MIERLKQRSLAVVAVGFLVAKLIVSTVSDEPWSDGLSLVFLVLACGCSIVLVLQGRELRRKARAEESAEGAAGLAPQQGGGAGSEDEDHEPHPGQGGL